MIGKRVQILDTKNFYYEGVIQDKLYNGKYLIKVVDTGGTEGLIEIRQAKIISTEQIISFID